MEALVSSIQSRTKSQVASVMIPREKFSKKVNEVIDKYVDTSAINLNKLIDGSSVNRPTASNAIAIHDLVRRLNGSGLKDLVKRLNGSV